MKNKVIYLVVLLITLYLALLYDFSSMRFLLVFLLLLFPVMGVWTLSAGRKVHVGLSVPHSVVFRQEKLSVRIHIKNDSFFPVSRIKIEMLEVDATTHEETELIMDEMTDGHDENTFLRDCEALHCGKCFWSIENIRIYDYLGLTSRRIRYNDRWEIQILPNIYHMNVLPDSSPTVDHHDAPEYDTDFPGDDVSEIFQIRDYRPGDSMQRIHWKMTAKEDTLMVKDYGNPVENVLILLLNPVYTEDRKHMADRMDDFYELSASLSASLLEQGYAHQVGWYEKDNFEMLQIIEEEDYHTFLGKLISIDVAEIREITGGEYHSMYPNSHLDSCYCLNTQLQLFRGEKLCVDFARVPRESWEGYRVIL